MGESCPPGFRLLLSSHDGRGKGVFLSFFYKGINLIPEVSPSLSNNLLQVLSPNIVILARRFSTYKFGENTNLWTTILGKDILWCFLLNVFFAVFTLLDGNPFRIYF